MKNNTLYDIHDRLLQVLEMAESGEYNDEVITDTLAAIEWELEEKADGYAKLITMLKGEIETINKEVVRLDNLVRRKQNLIDKLGENLRFVMTTTGKTNFKTTLHSFRIQKNPPSVAIVDKELIPSNFFIAQEPKLDKGKIAKQLKVGVQVPGTKLNQTESLRIS